MCGEVCNGWYLLKHNNISIIQERVPAGSAEVMHYHNAARQFFYVLKGEGMMVFEDREAVLKRDKALKSRHG